MWSLFLATRPHCPLPMTPSTPSWCAMLFTTSRSARPLAHGGRALRDVVKSIAHQDGVEGVIGKGQCGRVAKNRLHISKAGGVAQHLRTGVHDGHGARHD